MRTVVIESPIESNMSKKARDILEKIRRGVISDYDAARKLERKGIYIVSKTASHIELSTRVICDLGTAEIVMRFPL